MSRIDSVFKALKTQGRKALIPFIVAGDPDLALTYRLVLSMAESGGDIIELGIPYSDPLADGPVNQRAAVRALKNKIKIKDIMALVKKIREKTQVPLVYLVYFNCMMQYGIKRFLSDCAESGVDGLVIPDLPYEERQNYKEFFAASSVDIIALAAPTSKDRIDEIVKDASGFIYCVTSTGVTGTRQSFGTDFAPFMEAVAAASPVPRALGFGISSPEQAAALKPYAEGIIIGSAIVQRIEESRDGTEAINRVSDFLREVKAVL